MSLPHLTTSGKRLTNCQREALEWVSDGKTTQYIATLMGLTQATVEKHLRLARKVLGVETTAQAVIRAAFQNQIFLSKLLFPFKAFLLPLYRQKVSFSLLVDIRFICNHKFSSVSSG